MPTATVPNVEEARGRSSQKDTHVVHRGPPVAHIPGAPAGCQLGRRLARLAVGSAGALEVMFKMVLVSKISSET